MEKYSDSDKSGGGPESGGRSSRGGMDSPFGKNETTDGAIDRSPFGKTSPEEGTSDNSPFGRTGGMEESVNDSPFGNEGTGETEKTNGADDKLGLTEKTDEEIEGEVPSDTEETEEVGASKVPESAHISEKSMETEGKRAAAMDEISLKQYSDETLDKVKEDCAGLSFRDCEGETITYAEAMDRIHNDAESLLYQLSAQGREIDDAQRKAILSDIDKALLSQQAESESRAIGNHGIPHLYGNYERLRDTPDEVFERAAEQLRERHPESNATADDMRMAVLLGCVYHDEGYLSERVTGGPESAPVGDDMHGIDSAIAFENEHAPKLYGAVDSAVLEETTRAIAEHNLLKGETVKGIAETEAKNPARAEMLARIGGSVPGKLGDDEVFAAANMDPNENFVRSALLLSDKAATDADEKMADALRSPEAAGILMEYYQLQNTGAMSETQAEAAKVEMQEKLSEALKRDENLTDDQRERMLAAIERDVSARREKGDGAYKKGSYDYTFPTSGMAVSTDTLRFSLDENGDIQADVSITTRAAEDALYKGMYDGDPYANMSEKGREASKPELGAKKVVGQLEDMGITRDKLPEDADEILTPEDIETEGSVKFVVNTEGVETLSHVTVTIEAVPPEHPKAEVSEAEKELEARAEEIRDLELETKAQERINREALTALDRSISSGTVTRDDIASYCAQIYDEANSGEIDAIIARLTETEDMSQAELQNIAEDCKQVHVRSFEERLRDKLDTKVK